MTPDNFSIGTWLAFSLLGLLFAAVSAFTMPLFNWMSGKFWNRIMGGPSKRIPISCPYCAQELRVTLYKRKQGNRTVICTACKKPFDISDFVDEAWGKRSHEREQITEEK